MSRRMSDGGATYASGEGVLGLAAESIMTNTIISHAAWGLAIAQVPFIVNFFWSIRNGEKVTSDNPWNSTTLEWQTPTPPPHGNFITQPVVYRDAYEYSKPGASKDYLPQNEKV